MHIKVCKRNIEIFPLYYAFRLENLINNFESSNFKNKQNELLNICSAPSQYSAKL